MSSAWIDSSEQQDIKDIEKKFEDDFVSGGTREIESKKLEKLSDSEDYLRILGDLFLLLIKKQTIPIAYLFFRISFEKDKEGSIGIEAVEGEERRVFQ